MNGDLISRSALLAAYDKAHQGPPGGARKLIEDAPEALVRCKDCVNWIPGRITENDDFVQPRCKRNGGGWSANEFCSDAEKVVKRDGA